MYHSAFVCVFSHSSAESNWFQMNVWNFLSHLHTEPSQLHSNTTDHSATTIVAKSNLVIMGGGGVGGEKEVDLVFVWIELPLWNAKNGTTLPNWNLNKILAVVSHFQLSSSVKWLFFFSLLTSHMCMPVKFTIVTPHSCGLQLLFTYKTLAPEWND